MENEFSKPFIVTLQRYDIKVSVEKNRSNLTLPQVVEMLKSLLLAAEYDIDNINEYLNVE
jgi:hypothetical protein